MNWLDWFIWLFAPVCQAAVVWKMWRSGMYNRFATLFFHQLVALSLFLPKAIAYEMQAWVPYFWMYQFGTSTYLLLSCVVQYSVLQNTDTLDDRGAFRSETFICLLGFGAIFAFMAPILHADTTTRGVLLEAITSLWQFFRCALFLLCARFFWWAIKRRLRWRSTYLLIAYSFALGASIYGVAFFLGTFRSVVFSWVLRLAFDGLALALVIAVYCGKEYAPTELRRIEGLVLYNFRIVEKISQGAYGIVFEAEDLRLNHSVALKILRPTKRLTPKRLKAFQREIRVMSALAHPHICRAHTAFAINGDPVMVMELLIGEPLVDHLPWDGSLQKLTQMAIWFYEAADALAYAHAQGITHGDVHACNLFVTSSGVKLLDFGLCRFTNLLGPTGIVNSDGREMRSDVAMLGAMMYRAIGERRPTPSAGPNSGFKQFRKLVLRATGKNDMEYSSAVELRADLYRCLKQMAPDDWPLRRYPHESLLAESPGPWLKG